MRFDDYLGRINQPAPSDATIDTLRRLHIAHRDAFLFENLSIQTGGGISLALGDLERKFLDDGRGGTLPDQELLTLANAGKLSFPATLEKQTRRMLADPRADALGTRFAAQWLRLQDIDKVHPD